jgi:hypothetical protein
VLTRAVNTLLRVGVRQPPPTPPPDAAWERASAAPDPHPQTPLARYHTPSASVPVHHDWGINE